MARKVRATRTSGTSKRKEPMTVRLDPNQKIKVEISLEKVSQGQLYNRNRDLGWYLYQMTGGRR